MRILAIVSGEFGLRNVGNIQEHAPRRSNAPVINFFNTELPKDKDEDTIDVDAEEIEDAEIDDSTDSPTS